MKAHVLEQSAVIVPGSELLKLCDLPLPVPGRTDVLLRVAACGVCHTELDLIEGRLSARLPVIPGHQVIGYIEGRGAEARRFLPGARVGVAWISSACGHCDFCTSGLENLCPEYLATGRDVDGGYAEFMAVPEKFVFPVPAVFSDVEAAPLFCAGAIGYRSLRLAGLSNGEKIGLSGFGGSGHLVLKMIRHMYPGAKVYVFARNPAERAFALELGAVWAGSVIEKAPEPLRAIIDTTPVWSPVLAALENLSPGGRLIINSIRKESHDQESLLKLDYSRHLWMEKEIKSVANITRRDVAEFLEIAADASIMPHVEVYPFAEANQALYDLKAKRIKGSKVLKII